MRHFHVAERFVVAQVVTGPAGNQRVRLVFANHIHQLFDIFFRHFPGGIEPDQLNRSIVAGNLFHLRKALFHKVVIERSRITVFIHLRAAITARESPVLIVGIVKPEPQAFRTAGISEFMHGIFCPRRRCCDVETAGLGIIHRKTVVMLAGDDDVFHARFLGEPGDGAGIEFLRVEGARQFFVLRGRDVGHLRMHDPLADAIVGFSIDLVGQLGVEPPVNKHGIVSFTE